MKKEKDKGLKIGFIVTLILFVLNFLLMGYLNFQYNGILESLNNKPDIEIQVSPFLQSAPFGEYLPMIVTNTGDFTLTDVYIGIWSCEMDRYETYSLPLIPSGIQMEIPFGSKKVIEGFKEKECYPFSNGRNEGVSLNFTIGGGTNVTSSGISCGFCKFKSQIYAKYNDSGDIKNFHKEINLSFPYPSELIITISQ